MRFARSAVLQYLGTIGKRIDMLSFPSPTYGSVTLELYDLSDPTRLNRADAGTFPVQPMATDPRPGCRDFLSRWPGEQVSFCRLLLTGNMDLGRLSPVTAFYQTYPESEPSRLPRCR
jgi:hypothetical protein